MSLKLVCYSRERARVQVILENGDEKVEEENVGKEEVDAGEEDYQDIDLFIGTVWALKVTGIGRAGNSGGTWWTRTTRLFIQG